MDKFEKRLKQDAAAIEAPVSAQLRSRIDASLHGIEPLRPASKAPAATSPGLWWASSLTGLAATVMVIVLINWNRTEPNMAPLPAIAEATVPADPEPLLVAPLLDIRTADFASPLEEELVRLQSDIEKARESVRKDLDFTF